MDIVTAGMWRYPNARAERVDNEWWVRLIGPAELVIPRGAVADDDDDRIPLPLPVTLHEVSRDLIDLGGLNPHQAAGRLERHCQRYGAIELCRDHGLPIWHHYPDRTPVGEHEFSSGLRPSCPVGNFPGSDDVGIRVIDVSRLALFLDAMTRLASHATLRRTAAPSNLIEQVLDLPLMPVAVFGGLGVSRGEFTSLTDSKRVVRVTLDAATEASGLMICTRWERQRRPETALQARSTTALHIADLRSHVGTEDPDRSTTCQVCGDPVTMQRRPRPGDGIYCRKPECQGERNRRKQVRRRAKEKTHG